jgi:hypothetical protein
LSKYAEKVMRLTVIVFLILSSAAVAQMKAKEPQDRIPVFVRSGGDAAGFTDPSKTRQDSRKDLLRKLKDSKSIVLVESENDALAVLEVLDRDTKRETNVWGRQNKSYLAVRLTAGEYSVEFTGESGSSGALTGYGAAAGKVVKQLEAWVNANHDRLLALKK